VSVHNQERELKLTPHDAALLDRLASVQTLGELSAKGRHRELQRNSFFDTSDRALARAKMGFRRRTIDGQTLATWSLKADGVHAAGVATRTEIELQLDPDMAPALALSALGQAARQRGAALVAEELADALANGAVPLAAPFLETKTERTVVDLESAKHGWAIELALDRMRLLGHDYQELEIEAELKSGDDAAFESVRTAIEGLGNVKESEGSKLSRAIAHVNSCRCTSTQR
jgi:inorganic triphosphatase YgiF